MPIKLKNMSYGAALAASACFMLFVYAPIELYFTNQNEFFYDLYLLIPPLLINFAIGFLLSMALFMLASRLKIYNLILCLYLGAFISAYIQGNYMSKWIPVIEGGLIEWNDYSIERIKSILLWVSVSAVMLVIHKKVTERGLKRLLKGVSIFMFLMLLLTAVFLGISTNGFEKKTIYSTSNTKDLFELSNNRNFIILLLDKTDSGVQNELMLQDISYENVYEDFTYYTNTLGGYQYTHESIPFILTGEWYKKETDFMTYQKKAYEKSPLFELLKQNGYKVDIYDSEFPAHLVDDEKISNVVYCKRRISDYFKFNRWQIMLTGYRYAPFDLKRFCYVWTMELNDLKSLPEGVTELGFESSNYIFAEEVDKAEINKTENKIFKFIHLNGAHDPWDCDENLNRVGVENSDYQTCIKGTITLTDKYLKYLKASDMYDNSCIIVMSDHGGKDLRDHPIFFVKGFNEHHKMLRNDAPISYEDCQDIFNRLLSGCKSDKITDWSEGDYRERNFILNSIPNPYIVCIQKGYAEDESTLQKLQIIE